MAYRVNVLAGDSLCRIARRNGYGNCGTIRTYAANAAFLDRPLQPGVDQVTIPQSWNAWVPLFESVATGRRWVFNLNQAVRQAATVRFVRTGAGLPANGDAIADIGISRYPTGHVDIDKTNAFPADNQRAYDAAAFADPNTFNVEVVDPNVVGGNVSVHLEVLYPVYRIIGGQIINILRWDRFPAGPVRNARSLVVTAAPTNAVPARRRSCYLRLVADEYDRQRLPNQTLLVTDMVAQGNERVEILDQNVRARYEDTTCNRAAGDRCLLAEAVLPLRRGESVEVRAHVLRAQRTGVVGTDANGLGDDGFVSRRTMRHRVLVNARRVWAQNEVTFDLTTLETVDAPSDMLTVSEPDGAASAGTNGGGVAPGQVGLTVVVHPHGGNPQQHQVQAFAIAGGQTAQQTAQALAQRLNQIQNLTATVSANPAVRGHAAGSVDVVLSYPDAWVSVQGLTASVSQDSAQKVAVVSIDPRALAVRAGISDAYAGGPMQRALFKAFPTASQSLDLYVVERIAGINAIAHTLNAQRYMLAAHRAPNAVRNCLVLSREVVQDDLTQKPYTLAHEIGHALSDNAEHLLANDDFEGLMRAGTSNQASVNGDQTKRISSVADDWYVVVDQGNLDVADPNIVTMGLRQQNYDMPARIAQEGHQAVTFTNR